jgi:hypothetical protein
MADRTDFNDMDGGIAGQVNSAKTFEEERQEALQVAKCSVSQLMSRFSSDKPMNRQ